ncbi:rod shape-determining protein MreC [Rubrolithibacter danxiaensis]|uniref:rod shape-determining protein MreC n=1 Tax=Rubrolithibacter danxiaensis TaxID=3390805 RepID=UPI003BF87A32
MRNLWIFISKYNAFFLFAISFVGSLVIAIKNNSFQRATVINSSNEVVGEIYSRVNHFKEYLNLVNVNDSLAAENARLRNSLKSSKFDDSVAQNIVNDTLTKQQYTYIVSRVVNNSIHQKNNYLTINRGKRHGVEKGMGVISPSGVVGIVLQTSDNFSTVQSILHTDTRISASIEGSNAFGSLIWGEEDFDPQTATLKDIPNHVIVKKGQKVVTSGFSLFPHDILIGKVVDTGVKGGDSFLDIKVHLSTDFSTLQYVYVVKNTLSQEQQQLETESKKDE